MRPTVARAGKRGIGHTIPADLSIFEDLRRCPAEAKNLRLRADLMIKLTDVVERRNLTQARAAKVLGVTQPRVSDLLRGKITLFSLDSLVAMLHRAGASVELTVRAA